MMTYVEYLALKTRNVIHPKKIVTDPRFYVFMFF